MSDIIKALHAAQSVGVISHISPDGDTLGSGLALVAALRELGKRSFLMCDGKPQTELLCLPGIDELQEVPPYDTDVIVAVDCSDELRMGSLAPYFHAAKTSIVIDHHKSNSGFGGLCFIDEDASATGEIMYDVIDALGVNFTTDMAQCLYAAIATDTGNFSYSNTTPTALAYMATLLTVGFDLAKLNDKLFRSKSLAKTKLIGLCISKIELINDNKFGYSILKYDEVTSTGADSRDFDSIIDVIRDIDTVEVALLVRQNAEGGYKASLRSADGVDSSEICGRFGGGGHARAAGASITEDQIQPFIACIMEAM